MNIRVNMFDLYQKELLFFQVTDKATKLVGNLKKYQN